MTNGGRKDMETMDEPKKGLKRIYGEMSLPTLEVGTEQPSMSSLPILEGNKLLRPLSLTNLPIDMLNLIFEEIPKTNDLVHLSQTCRTLYFITIPLIYALFDIYLSDDVNSLTHGLAPLTDVTSRRNNYAQFIKRFSFHNRLPNLVQDQNYNIQSGKHQRESLCTLVNTAVSGMNKLESFSWDMPTGVLRDVFEILWNIETLKSVHIRFHDTRNTHCQVEKPTFKGLKGLCTLSVLDIDEAQYIVEMADAIENSVDTLEALRVGISYHTASTHAHDANYTFLPDWTPLEPKAGDLIHDKPITGGVLGMLFSGITQLKLRSLALERVPISAAILINNNAIDWTVLTSLTIMNCYGDGNLWRALSCKYRPRTKDGSQSQYRLHMKKIHTDRISKRLIEFIHDTLAPNTLEVLVLHETIRECNVTLSEIHKGAIRRHKGSLKKLLIKSCFKYPHSNAHYKWAFQRENIAFISCGKMPKLRELSIALEYKDWHYFLQRLTYIPHLHTLHITYIRDYPRHRKIYADLAKSVLNTVILRPQMELCYFGIMGKCYEIFQPQEDGYDSVSDDSEADIADGEDVDSDAGDDTDADDEAWELSFNNPVPAPLPSNIQPAGTVILNTGGAAPLTMTIFPPLSPPLPPQPPVAVKRYKGDDLLRIKEILFFDEAEIFRARHEKLLPPVDNSTRSTNMDF